MLVVLPFSLPLLHNTFLTFFFHFMLTAKNQTTTTTTTLSFSYGTDHMVVMEKQINPNLKEESPRKVSGNGGGGDSKLKRDEWSEGAVSSLLEAYESKWVLRNRAKLKGHDWEDVARQVSGRANFTRSPKTQTQCKNKIESMKKRYRSESATADGSSWPLYPRLDLLLRGTGTAGAVTAAVVQAPATAVEEFPSAAATGGGGAPMLVLEAVPVVHPPPEMAAAILSPPPVVIGIAQNSHGSNGVDRTQKEDDEAKASMERNMTVDTDSSTPALYSEKSDKLMMRSPEKWKTTNNNSNNNNNNNKTDHNHKRKRVKKTRDDHSEIAESIRWLAEVVVKAEQARMETMKEIERMRMEAEAKRAEMELKRTEIVANTQLEIARIFSASNSKGVDSSLRIGRS